MGKTGKKTKKSNKQRPKVKSAKKRVYEDVNEDASYNDSDKTDAKEEKPKNDESTERSGTIGAKKDDKTKETKDEGSSERSETIHAKKDDKAKEANGIVDKYVRWAVGFSIVPIPLFDMASVFVIQLRMLKKLADHYKVNFSEELVKALITSLVGALNSGVIGGTLMTSMFKLLPGLGFLAGITSMCLVSGATTYAVGKVFIQHFESGGTFLNFDPEKVKEYFKKQFEDGKNIAKEASKNIKNKI